MSHARANVEINEENNDSSVDKNQQKIASNTILVVEDDHSLRDIMGKTLAMDGFKVITAESGAEALEIIRSRQDVSLMISDVQMEPMDGIQLLNRTKSLYPDLPVIMMTAYGTIENAVNAMHDGATDYLVKPFEYDELVSLARKYIRSASDERTEHSSSGLIAVDKKSLDMANVAKRVAESDATVMITGESGVGKEVVSRYIHQHSHRADGPFVAINCAAIPESMLESVLFGYEKGAYTGAHQSRAGKFEQAQGGTLLLDEITEMDLGLQAKLLRVLQEREVERLGGNKIIALDVRILATTNRDLQQAVADGRFREDLYYRLNVFPINILPLSERIDDIIPLANMMLNTYGDETEKLYFSISAQRKLRTYNWPGNVRELDNVVQRALILKSGLLVEESDIQFEETTTNLPQVEKQTCNSATIPPETGLSGDLKAREHDLIISALTAKNSRKEVAEKLGISPRTLRYKIARMRDAGVPIPA